MSAINSLYEFGFDREAVLKAQRHFGDKLQVETAVDWILNGCPDYNPDRVANVASVDNSARAVVPYKPAAANTSSRWSPELATPNEGQKSNPEWEAVSSLAALQAETLRQQQWAGHDAEAALREVAARGAAEDAMDESIDGLSNKAGRCSPVDHAAVNSANNPIDLTAGDNVSGMKGLLDAAASSEEDEIQRAIRLSLEDHAPPFQPTPLIQNAATATSMSRGPSRSRQLQEDADMAAAMSASMAELETQGANSVASLVLEDSHSASRMRTSADVPVMIVPPSGYLAFIGPVLASFFYNIPFRNAVLALEIEWRDSFSYNEYAGEIPELDAFTRDLATGSGNVATLRLAALQRLFVFLLHTRRAKIGIGDIMDAFDIRKPDYPPRHALTEIKSLHEKICEAWSKWHEERAVNMVNSQAMTQAEAEAWVDQKRLIVYTVGCTLNDSIARQYLETGNAGLLTVEPADSTWLNAAEVNVHVGETNDTYAALDTLLANAGAPAFVFQAGDALFVQAMRHPNSQSGYGDPTKLPQYEIRPEIYLDRYAWCNRAEVLQFRQQGQAAQAQTRGLDAAREQLVTHKATGRAIISPNDAQTASFPATDVHVPPEQKGNGVLNQATKHLQRAADAETDPSKQAALLELVKQLTATIQAVGTEIAWIDESKRAVTQNNRVQWPKHEQKYGPYVLSTSIMWSGFFGRGTVYSYVQSGSSAVDLDGVNVEAKKWWKMSDTGVEEVPFDTVLNDTTGLHLTGGGPIQQSYVLASALDAAMSIGSQTGNGVQLMMRAVERDNVDFRNELPAELTKDWFIEPSITTEVETKAINESDVKMIAATDDLVISDSTEPLRLSGGSSDALVAGRAAGRQRRGSAASETGSIASTSRMKIGDFENDDDDDDEGGEASEPEETTELGFAAKLKKSFKVVKDVGKIGGKPTWLNPALPLELDMIICETCQTPMQFMLQVNAPLDDNPSATYRAFYVYACRKGSCVRMGFACGVKVLRVQLPESNPYYELDSAEEQADLQRYKDAQYRRLCQDCKISHDPPCSSRPWQEWLIETAPEEWYEDDKTGTDETEARIKAAVLANENVSEEDKYEPDSYSGVDSAFLRFQDRLRHEPAQLLRYYYRDVARRAGPLWVSDDQKVSPSNIPVCKCGSRRSCELQILSTLLARIGVDDTDKEAIDFGTILIFTCDAACNTNKLDSSHWSPGDNYEHLRPHADWAWQNEIAFVQNYSARGVSFGRSR